MDNKKILLHCCCGPCAVACIDFLRSNEVEPVTLFVNPNIHPYQEYKAREASFKQVMHDKNVEIAEIGEYGLHGFLKAVFDSELDRCPVCYQMRMNYAAKLACRLKISSFTTSLLISPYQNREGLVASGEKAGQVHAVAFSDYDFRFLFRQGQKQARQMGLYMQKYCGCIFSEEERYRAKQL